MNVFARHDLVDTRIDSVDEELLLEGSWPAGDRPMGRWSLDETIDARFAWIDRLAAEYAHRAALPGSGSRQSVNFPYINALSLRYYCVKLLRVLAFFRDARPLTHGEPLALHLSAKRDEAYADLFQQLAQRCGGRLDLRWYEPPSVTKQVRRRSLPWRTWAAHAAHKQRPASRPNDLSAPRVVLCGNPRILNPICAELVERGCRVWWLYERFAIRCWWRWRGNVEQLVCEADGAARRSFSDTSVAGELCFDGIDLGPPIERWLSQLATQLGPSQSRLVERVDAHFRQIQPTSLVLDEDATPLKRIAVALAQGHGARSTVVQHGAPCGSLGFIHLTADEICVWGESSRRQLESWGMPAEKIRVTGWPCLQQQLQVHCRSCSGELESVAGAELAATDVLLANTLCRPTMPRSSRTGASPRTECTVRGRASRAALPQPPGIPQSSIDRALPKASGKRFLLLATMRPRDERPDNVEFHLTTENHAMMLDMVYRVLGLVEGASLTVKLHPRARKSHNVGLPSSLLARQQSSERNDGRSLSAGFPVRFVHGGNLAQLVAASDCVLSCASTAGIEAALAGAPVVQILPAGSGDILPAREWGFVGSARTADELASLVAEALDCGWQKNTSAIGHVLAEQGRRAASRVVDGLVESVCCVSKM